MRRELDVEGVTRLAKDGYSDREIGRIYGQSQPAVKRFRRFHKITSASGYKAGLRGGLWFGYANEAVVAAVYAGRRYDDDPRGAADCLTGRAHLPHRATTYLHGKSSIEASGTRIAAPGGRVSGSIFTQLSHGVRK